MIKAVLFDYDGVITKGVHDAGPAERLAKDLGVEPSKALEWVQTVWQMLRIGKMSEAEAWEYIEKKHGGPVADEHRDIWFRWDELEPLPEMQKLAQDLNLRGVTTAILSNVIAPTAELIRSRGDYDGFYPVVLSYEVGQAKPGKEIFEIALQKLGEVQPEEVVFLDDRKPAVIVARDLGMHAIQVTDHAVAIRELKELLDRPAAIK